MTNTFQNPKLQTLYDTLGSKEVYNLKYINAIHEAIYPLLKAVIDDQEAYAEAVFSWQQFQIVIDVLEHGDKEFVHLSDSESMCYSLWWNTDHRHLDEPNSNTENNEFLNNLNEYLESYNGPEVVYI